MELRKGMKFSECKFGILSEKNGENEIWCNFYLVKYMATFLYSQMSRIYYICKSPKVGESWEHILWWSLLFCNAHVINLWSWNGTNVLCYRADLAQKQKPQPMNPELTCWPVSGILDMLNNFRGKGQPFGDQNCISLELPRKVICIVIFLK